MWFHVSTQRSESSPVIESDVHGHDMIHSIEQALPSYETVGQ